MNQDSMLVSVKPGVGWSIAIWGQWWNQDHGVTVRHGPFEFYADMREFVMEEYDLDIYEMSMMEKDDPECMQEWSEEVRTKAIEFVTCEDLPLFSPKEE